MDGRWVSGEQGAVDKPRLEVVEGQGEVGYVCEGEGTVCHRLNEIMIGCGGGEENLACIGSFCGLAVWTNDTLEELQSMSAIDEVRIQRNILS